MARRAWEDGGRGREKQSANLQVLHRRTGREGGHAATGRRETEITTTSRGAHAAGGRGAASGVTPARSGAERSKPGLSGAEQWRSLWEASSLLGERGAQGPGLPGPSGAPAQDQVGLTGPDSSPLHCSETQFGALSGILDGTELKLSKVRILVLLHTRLSWAGRPTPPHQGRPQPRRACGSKAGASGLQAGAGASP